MAQRFRVNWDFRLGALGFGSMGSIANDGESNSAGLTFNFCM